MTFLNPSGLYALPLVALPIVIHFLARQRARLFRISTLRFLEELEHSEIRRLRLREVLLLILRTMAVFCIVMLLARPAIVPSGVPAHTVGSRTIAWIVLDDSYSMRAWTPEGTVYRRACRIARTIAGTLGPEDVGTVILPRGEQKPAAIHRMEIPLREETSPWERSGDGVFGNDFREPLRLALKQLPQFAGFRREIYLVSDFAGSVQLPDSLMNLLGHEAQLFFVPVRRPPLTNLTLRRVALGSQLLQPGADLPVSIEVANTADEPAKDRLVQMFWNGEPVAQSTVSLDPGQETELSLRVTTTTSGWQRGVVVLEDDALEVDNRFWIALRIPERLRVLVVSSGPSGRAVEIALAPPGAGTGLYEVVRKSPEALGTGDVRKADVVILADAGPLLASTREELVDRVRNGTCLIILPGPHTDPRLLSQEVLERLNLPGLQGTFGRQGGAVPVASVNWMDGDHPVFSGIFEERAPRISLPLVYFGLRFTRADSATPILRCSNGEPFLLEATGGRGKVFVFASGVDENWSDLARRGIFVALMQRLPLYAKFQADGGDQVRFAGEPLEVVDDRLSPGSDYVMELPGGNRVRLAPETVPGGTLLRLAETSQPGIYSLYVDDQLHRMFAVNADPKEGELRQAAVNVLASRYGAVVLEPGPDLAERIQKMRRGKELWPWLAGSLLILLLTEMILARTPASEPEEDAVRRKQTTAVSV